jgi:putative methyltransferase (TIGR04325 family)
MSKPLKNLIKKLVPQWILSQAIKGYWAIKFFGLSGDLHYLFPLKQKTFFKGIFTSWEASEKSRPTDYEISHNVSNTVNQARQLSEEYVLLKFKNVGESLPRSSLSTVTSGYLPLALSLLGVTSSATKQVVLDFGGGGGGDFFKALLHLPRASAIEYHVVDLPTTIRTAKNNPYFSGDGLSQLHLHESLDSTKGLKVDVMYAGSSLQYLPSLGFQLSLLKAANAPYFLVTNTPVFIGKHASFVTHQVNTPGVMTPMWFHNLDSFLSEFSVAGYEPCFISTSPVAHINLDFVSHLQIDVRFVNILFHEK